MALGKFKELMAEYSNSIKSLKKAEGFSEILMPGEIEYRKEQNSLKDGIELDPQLISALDELLVQAGSNIRLGENKGGA